MTSRWIPEIDGGKVNNPDGIHAFERAGLGKYPFKVIGFTEKVYQACPGTPLQAAGSCDFCGTGCRYMAIIEGSDGKRFDVGCDCVGRVGDAGLLRAIKTSAEYRAMQRAKRQTLDDAKKAEWARLMADSATIARISADEIESLSRVWKMCGASGRARYLKHLKKVLAN